jgi:hypothetical protein
VAGCGESAVEERLVNVLAHIWNQVRWRRIRGRRPLDVFEHRLEYAKYEPDIASALQRLANTLSIQGVSAPLEDVEFLRQCNEEAMDVLRKWTKLLALKASVKAKELRAQKAPEASASQGGEK